MELFLWNSLPGPPRRTVHEDVSGWWWWIRNRQEGICWGGRSAASCQQPLWLVEFPVCLSVLRSTAPWGFKVRRAQTEGVCPMQVLMFLSFLRGSAYAREEGQRGAQSPSGARIMVQYNTSSECLNCWNLGLCMLPREQNLGGKIWLMEFQVCLPSWWKASPGGKPAWL